MATLTLQQLIDNRLTTELGYIQKIEVFNQRGKHISGTVVQFAYGNWLTTVTPLFRRNGAIFTPTSNDTTAGTATITDLTAHDDIDADYTFKYFSNTDLQNFYKLALSRLNNTAPATSMTFDDSTAGTTATYSVDMEDYLTSYAYKLCLQTLLIDLAGWRARIIFEPISLGGYLTSVIGQLDGYLMSIARTVKGRRFLTPHSVASGRWGVPPRVTDSNWQAFTVVRA